MVEKHNTIMKVLCAFSLCAMSAVVVPQSSKTLANSECAQLISGVENTEQSHQEGVLCPDENHPHMIDLGLPSGTKWSCCNVGASVPEELGGYYAWGETEEKDEYFVSDYKYAVLDDKNGSILHVDRHKFRCLDIGYNICGTKYDVAHVKWGGSWRMPKRQELVELIEKCVGYWKTYNGVNGYLFVGPNRNRIFMPAAGYRLCSGLINGSNGNYWTGAITSFGTGVTSNDAESLRFFESQGNGLILDVSACTRYYGLSVRPVAEK